MLSIRLSSDGLSFWHTALHQSAGPEEEGFRPDYGAESTERFIPIAPTADALHTALSQIPAKDAAQTVLMIDTQHTVLVPGEVFESALCDGYLRINNIIPTTADRVVTAAVTGDYPFRKAVLVCDASTLATAQSIFSQHLTLSTPFEVAARVPYRHFGKPVPGSPAGTPRGKIDRRLRDFLFKPCVSLYLTGTNAYIVVLIAGTGQWRYAEVLPYSGTSDLLYYMRELSALFDTAANPIFIQGAGAKAACRALGKYYKRCICES